MDSFWLRLRPTERFKLVAPFRKACKDVSVGRKKRIGGKKMSRRFAVGASGTGLGKRALTGSVYGASPREQNTGTERMSLLETAGRPDERPHRAAVAEGGWDKDGPQSDRGGVRDAISRGASGGRLRGVSDKSGGLMALSRPAETVQEHDSGR